MNESRRAVDFGPYRLLADQRLLIEDETPVPLGRRAFDILIALVDRRSEVVSKDELMHRVWGSQVVEENTLAVHLSALRKALGDGKEGIRYIDTVPGRGYQFVAPVEAVREPAEPEADGKAAEKPTGNLPRATGPLIGRDAALTAVVSALGTAPLVTLSGPGGIGKTRLALAVAARVAKHYRDGVWWADLTAIGDPTLAVGTVAQALDIQLGNASPLPRLMSGLKGRELLLVLDNCEHVAGAVAELCVAMREHAEIRLLATSQEPLGVAGEQVERLEPLALPEAGPAAEITASEALAAPAVQLFAERARSIEPRFTIDDDSVGAVVAMCRRLEGVPLALELAAARAALLGVEPAATRLDRQLLELSGGRRDMLPKHQTLRALLDWSHGLLSPAERIVLRRLAIFAGGCTLEATEAVAADDEVPDWEVADHLTSLIGKSLVIAERTAQGRALPPARDDPPLCRRAAWRQRRADRDRPPPCPLLRPAVRGLGQGLSTYAGTGMASGPYAGTGQSAGSAELHARRSPARADRHRIGSKRRPAVRQPGSDRRVSQLHRAGHGRRDSGYIASASRHPDCQDGGNTWEFRPAARPGTRRAGRRDVPAARQPGKAGVRPHHGGSNAGDVRPARRGRHCPA